MKFKNMKRIVALGLAMMMAAAVVPASPVSAKTKYKTVKEDGKEYIVFGSYEQDGNTKNGKEPIEWEILDENKNGILVISRYVLDSKPFNKIQDNVTWEKSTLRKWLNKDFYNDAFNNSEKKNIMKAKISNPDYYDLMKLKDTKDNVFLLSEAEILEYYEFDIFYDGDNPDENGGCTYGYSQALMAKGTKYAIAKGLYAQKIAKSKFNKYFKNIGYEKSCLSEVYSPWWSRTTDYSEQASYVGYDGYTGWLYWNCGVSNVDVGVRPAMYLKK